MNFYYDIVLNFSDDFLMFYEWDSTDNIEYYKKIPLFSVSNKTLKDFINNEICVNKEFLELIQDKAKCRNHNSSYVAIFADKNGAIALEFDKNGKSIARSYLDIYDELNLIEYIYTIKQEKITYEIIKPITFVTEVRKVKKMKFFIKTELTSLVNRKDYKKLKYLYMEWFSKEPKNNQDMIKEMILALNNDINNNEIKIYNLIKLSYSNV